RPRVAHLAGEGEAAQAPEEVAIGVLTECTDLGAEGLDAHTAAESHAVEGRLPDLDDHRDGAGLAVDEAAVDLHPTEDAHHLDLGLSVGEGGLGVDLPLFDGVARLI